MRESIYICINWDHGGREGGGGRGRERERGTDPLWENI